MNMILEMMPPNIELVEHYELLPEQRVYTPQIRSLFTQHDLDSGLALGSIIDALFVISLEMEMPDDIFADFMDGLKREYSSVSKTNE